MWFCGFVRAEFGGLIAWIAAAYDWQRIYDEGDHVYEVQKVHRDVGCHSCLFPVLLSLIPLQPRFFLASEGEGFHC